MKQAVGVFGVVLFVLAVGACQSASERQAALMDAGLCKPAAIRSASNPDERYYHCRGLNWRDTTEVKDRLGKLRADPTRYQQYCTPDAAGSQFLDTMWVAICGDTPQLEAAQSKPQPNPFQALGSIQIDAQKKANTKEGEQ
jgi:hypothetical protein